ncbi:MAG TPA: hypothetical protein VMG36_07205 [Thermoplasmata archaeon]|nr:hypothetical protein [Thermoplasmata archaeon]
MAVCLHCGEAGAPGALFCTKCGYTLPQGNAAPLAPPTPLSVAAPGSGAPGSAPGAPYRPVAPAPFAYPYAPHMTIAAVPPGAVGPGPPPPNAKYCIRCGSAIAQPAVYCPVCQQPQG